MTSKIVFIMALLFVYTLSSPKQMEEVNLHSLCELKRDLNIKLDETSRIYSDLMSDTASIEQLRIITKTK